MSERICPICAERIERTSPFFDVPKLPQRYGFGELTGPVHRDCLSDYERRGELRSAIARSIAGADHSPPDRWIAAVDGSILRLREPRYEEHTIWNLADFATFPVVDRAVDELCEATAGDTVSVAFRPETKLEFLDRNITRLITLAGDVLMPSLGLDRMKSLMSHERHIETRDALVRVVAGSNSLPSHNSIVGWVQGIVDDEPPPVLLRPLTHRGNQASLAYSVTGIDPNLELQLPTRQPVRLRTQPDVEFEVIVFREISVGPDQAAGRGSFDVEDSALDHSAPRRWIG